MTAAQLRDVEADKRVATARAKVALAGAVLNVQGADGRPAFRVSSWAIRKEFDSLDTLEAWLAQIEGAQHARMGR